MAPTKLFLFDLDGTLVTTGGAGLRALSRAFLELYEIPDVMTSLNPCGKTDPAIFREIIETSLNREMTPEDLAESTRLYLLRLAEEMKENKKAKPLPGVEAFLRLVKPREDILLGLGTGNLEKGARLKLAPSRLNDFFEFGGFGSDAESRPELLQIGHRRAEEAAGAPIKKKNVYIIGDTPLDVNAARDAGYHSVAVASGSISYEALEGAGPDFLLRDMTEGHQFLEVIDGKTIETGA